MVDNVRWGFEPTVGRKAGSPGQRVPPAPQSLHKTRSVSDPALDGRERERLSHWSAWAPRSGFTLTRRLLGAGSLALSHKLGDFLVRCRGDVAAMSNEHQTLLDGTACAMGCVRDYEPMNEPYQVSPAPANGLAGGWFCPACHSLNRAGATRCYSCRANTPLVVSRTPASRNKGLVGLLLVIALVFAGLGGSVVFGRTTAPQSKPTDNPIGIIALASDQSALPTAGDSEASDSATPSVAIPTMSTPEATSTPRTTVAPTPRTTAAPTPRTTVAPTPRTTVAPTPAATAAPTAPPADTVALPKFSYPIAGVTVKYLAIDGDTPDALIEADETASTQACKMDSLACFYDSYSWSFAGQTDAASGVCAVSSVDLTASYMIILPNWTSPARVPAALVPWWKLVMAHIVWHESQHLAIAREYTPKVKAALLNGPCTNAGSKAAAQAVLDDLKAAQDAFDAQQTAAGWSYPPYSGPWS
jgi:predicted secreted Zn-dependent protease